jgi:hypothetical protein
MTDINSEFSLFENHASTHPTTITLAEANQIITDTNSPIKSQTQLIQTTYNSNGGGKEGKKAIAPHKGKLPVASFGATGDRKVVQTPSGLICADIDGTGDKTEEILGKLTNCPHVALSFISPSGDGIKAVLRIPAINVGDQNEMRRKFKIAFKAIAAYILEITGVHVDVTCSDILRLCYLPHDPHAYLNEDAVEFPVDFSADASEEEQTHSIIACDKPTGKPVPIEIVRALLFCIVPRPNYDIWLRICAAVRNSLGDIQVAIVLLKDWSKEEEPEEYERLLKSPFEEIGIGTLRHLAAQNDYFYVYELFAYDESKGHYLLCWGGQWVRLRGEGATKDHLRQFLGKLPADCPTCKIRTERNVAFAGKIAGYKSGIIESNGSRILITEGPEILIPRECDWPILRRFLETLIPDQEQRIVFLSWFKHFRDAVVNGRRSQAPCMTLVGDRSNGKSLMISIINKCISGRSASAHRFLSGSTPFNSDVIGSELLVIDDEAASTDFRTRLKLAQNIKNHFFTECVRLEAKGVDAISVAPIQALIIAVNSDPQHLRVLPELDETMRDKIILISTHRGELPDDLRGSSRLESVLAEEIPGFLHFLEGQDYANQYESGRLRCYWCPQVVEALGLLAPERQLHQLILATPSLSQTYRPGAVVPEFTAMQIQAALMENNATKHSATMLLTYNNACGIYLGKLADTPGTGISRGRLDSRTRIQKWAIDLPMDGCE